MCRAAAPNVACPEGYAGKFGVKFFNPGEFVLGAPSGSHPGSPSLKSAATPVYGAAGPRVSSCSRMPTTGRQKSWQYFCSHARIPASAMAALTKANRRAFCPSLLFCSPATLRTIWL
jgi:hypothetical protein